MSNVGKDLSKNNRSIDKITTVDFTTVFCFSFLPKLANIQIIRGEFQNVFENRIRAFSWQEIFDYTCS